MKILVTGGAGYIGSHTAVELLDAGHEIAIVDNLSNSKIEAVNRIKEISNREFKFYQVDLLDENGLRNVFLENDFDAVIHFAGFKAVGESVSKPLKYYYNNITSTVMLLEMMSEFGVKKIVFSSSATVYDSSNKPPLKEDMKLGTTNPYGSTKFMIEEILRDLYASDSEWAISILRYFNPIGAHKCGRIGEDPNGIPNNLMPYITQVAVGKREKLSVFGSDYDTHDGTGVRDYIHVVDLAIGHIKALDKISNNKGVFTYNLGTGIGCSVLDVVNNFIKATGKEILYEIVDRRPGDIDVCFADSTRALDELGWKTKYDLYNMCLDSWNWQKNNPNGYEK